MTSENKVLLIIFIIYITDKMYRWNKERLANHKRAKENSSDLELTLLVQEAFTRIRFLEEELTSTQVLLSSFKRKEESKHNHYRDYEKKEYEKGGEKKEYKRPVTCWDFLGIKKGASRTEIVRAYRTKALKMHPDKGGNKADFMNLQKAREMCLKNTRHA